ncbi:MAG: DUF4280 domain-containing protein, partial [Defluviitaleaceae bacterium]|nr:DUF4280 domain-containing protein [Defluviitaleaceae bacterium]
MNDEIMDVLEGGSDSEGSDPEGHEIVVNHATLKCSKGSATCPFEVPEGTRKIHGETIAIRTDIGKCIGFFGICDILTAQNAGMPTPCVPHQVSFPWTIVANDFIYKGEPVVIDISITFCPVGGTISVVESGQTGENRVTDNADLELENVEDLFDKIMQLILSGKFDNGILKLGGPEATQILVNIRDGVQAGIQRAAKAIWDPINTATGNFYYAKTDIKISGKHPLEFKRFYNTIGGTTSVLGRGWTHNYNIKLIKENGEQNILLGDGRLEAYDKEKYKNYTFNEKGDLLFITD